MTPHEAFINCASSYVAVGVALIVLGAAVGVAAIAAVIATLSKRTD